MTSAQHFSSHLHREYSIAAPAITAEYQLIGSVHRQAWISACDRKPLVESPLEAGTAVAFEIYAVYPEPVTRAQ